MAATSANFFMQDGRLFESVFYNRGGDQDFRIYTNDGTDIGRIFMRGAGGFTTGYQRSDGTDIGKLFFDNTWPVSGYISADMPVGGEITICDDERDEYNNGSYSNLHNLVAHPQNGSGLYTYYWRLMKLRDRKKWLESGWQHNVTGYSRTASTLIFPGGYTGDFWYNRENPIRFECDITDQVTGNRTTVTATFTIAWRSTCDYCDDNCDCD